MSLYLTQEIITENCGSQNPGEVQELEILFQGFEEVAGLDICPNLRRFTAIDNGLKRISNLQPVSNTLVSLCLCDQDLSTMDNLTLPSLRELFLHRNRIAKIGSLAGCPKLRRLWLFQNRLEQIQGLHAVPELEECWLQANQITKLSGLENNQRLQSLGLAGNPIFDFKELKRLTQCSSLKMVTFSDIHFGRCPIVDESGYKEFVTLHLGQVHVLDGVIVTKEAQLAAEDVYFAQLKSFNNSLLEVENSYQHELRDIDSQHKSKETYGKVLEKEMSAALEELHSLVKEGRSAINKQLQRNHNMIGINSNSLVHSLNELEGQAKSALKDNLALIHINFDDSASVLCLLEQLAEVDSMVVDCLSKAASNAEDVVEADLFRVVFQEVSNNSADFQMIASFISPTTTNQRRSKAQEMTQNGSDNSGKTSESAQSSTESSTCLAHLECTRLYRIVIDPSLEYGNLLLNGRANSNVGPGRDGWMSMQPPVMGASIQDLDYERVFTVVSLNELKIVLKKGWNGLGTSQIFSASAAVVAALYSSIGYAVNQSSQSEFASIVQEVDTVDDDNALLNMPLGSSSVEGTSGKKGSRGNRQKSSTAKDDSVTKLPKLKSAITSQVLLLMCCKFYHERVFVNGSAMRDEIPMRLNAPQNAEMVAQLVEEFQRSNRAQKLVLEHQIDDGGNRNACIENLLYLLSPSVCADSVSLDFLSVSVTPPPVDGSSLRTADYRLEPIMLPTTNVDFTAHILSTFENKASNEVRRYLDKLLEEVDESQSSALRGYESDVMNGEAALRDLREDIERERKGQDGMLRELKSVATGADGGSQSNNPHMPSGYSSNNNLRRNLSKR